MEGTFIFPVPKGARIDKFSMEVNGKMQKAELLDAKKARKIYEDIVRKALDPALFEYAGQSLFKVRIFPIEPKKEKEVKIKYTEISGTGRQDGPLPVPSQYQEVLLQTDQELVHEDRIGNFRGGNQIGLFPLARGGGQAPWQTTRGGRPGKEEHGDRC